MIRRWYLPMSWTRTPVEQECNIKPKSMRQLGMEGQWLLEVIDPEGYDVVVHRVSPVARFVLLHGSKPRW
jgi:hypothetical protein